MKTKPKGRPRDAKRMAQAKALRLAGLSYRAIARALLKNPDTKTIFRWLNYETVDKKLDA